MTSVKKIGILETGNPPEGLQQKHGLYPDMFVNLLRPLAPDYTFHVYHVRDNEFPATPTECDGWLVTGSAHGVYEEIDWMLRTEEFLRAVVGAGTPLVGICFGHQILAKAMGGVVEKSSKGLGLGFLQYDIVEKPEWMNPPLEKITVSTIHQDQVVQMPPSGRVVASSDFCPNGMIAYANSVFSIQSHPEFTKAYLNDLIEEKDIPENLRESARGTIATRSTNSDVIAQWIINILEQK